jgi:hypothetical protein
MIERNISPRSPEIKSEPTKKPSRKQAALKMEVIYSSKTSGFL